MRKCHFELSEKSLAGQFGAEISPPAACPERRHQVASRMGRNEKIIFVADNMSDGTSLLIKKDMDTH